MPSGLVRACRLSEHQYNIGTYSRYLGTSEQYKGGVGRWDGPNVDAGAMTTLEEPLHVPAEGRLEIWALVGWITVEPA